MRRLLTAALLFAAACPAALARDQSNDGIMVWSLDGTVSPCDDFYHFACNGWLKANPIPADQSSWGVDAVMTEANQQKLRQILEQAAATPDAETAKIGAYWSACMDEAAIEAKGLAALQPELDRIAALADKRQLAALLGHLHQIGVGALFSITADQDYHDATQVIAEIDQGGLGLPEKDYYLKTDKASVETRAAYLAHLGRMFALAGRPETGAKAVLALETRLAQSSLSAVQRRDPATLYHRVPHADLATLTPNFAWDEYLAAAGVAPFDSLNIVAPGFFKGLTTLLADTGLDDIKTYLTAQLLARAADQLPQAFVAESFAFYGKTLRGAQALKPRWKRCVADVDEDLGEDLGKIYVRSAFGPAAKAQILALVANIKAAYAQDIKDLPWMGEATKQKALAKLDAMAEKVGYPDRWRDYSAYRVERDDALGNALRGAAFEFNRTMAKIGRPVDKQEWGMTAPTVNAYYDPQHNDINFPAGILQPPNFDPSWDDAPNYGATGATIGHEMTHGFDDEGRQFDKDGNLRDWWTKTDARHFEQRSACLIKQYGGYSVAPGVKLDGKLTLGENSADNGGTRLALAALITTLGGKSVADIDGYNPQQRFFIAYAQSWCENETPAAATLQAQTNPHATALFRVNGVVADMPEFRAAFACKAGAPMAPKTMCRVW